MTTASELKEMADEVNRAIVHNTQRHYALMELMGRLETALRIAAAAQWSDEALSSIRSKKK